MAGRFFIPIKKTSVPSAEARRGHSILEAALLGSSWPVTKATVDAKQTKLDIPLERITQIRFAKAASETNLFPGDVRASFPGGESVVFKLDQWNAGQANGVRGVSRIFGNLAFDPQKIRQLQFNLDRTLVPEDAEANLDAEFLEAE